jgi:hypothetical protein
MCCLIVVPLPPGKNPFAVQLNNNNNNDSPGVYMGHPVPGGNKYRNLGVSKIEMALRSEKGCTSYD